MKRRVAGRIARPDSAAWELGEGELAGAFGVGAAVRLETRGELEHALEMGDEG